MPKFLSSKYIIKVLEDKGFKFKSQKGSHSKYVYLNKIVIVPIKQKEIPIGTFLSIVKQSGLKKGDFL
jgi:predicted RNA binding protein YcfA (HicA-like mRNA interferase family)